ncbi:unnamed protein product [Urochloa decumbens]|uniref:F-box domain-containing protein n=1 Tax=Urochloa decumbens TaxID=240449 RepID=A0ABC9DBP2_9POAL
MRRRSVSPRPALAPLPDDDDMLEEILLRLPPRPSSLPCASLVCKRWFRLLSDPRFLRRFRAFHRRNPPLLGFFIEGLDVDGIRRFFPTLDPPDRIPSTRLTIAPQPRDERWSFFGCRHGLALLLNRTHLEVTVWDLIAGDQRRVAVPQELLNREGADLVRQGALLCEEGRMPLEAFKVVLLADDWHPDRNNQVFASLYDSKTSAWCYLTSISTRGLPSPDKPSILVGNSFYWLLIGCEGGGILEFNLDRKSLALIKQPVGADVTQYSCFQILRFEAGGLGLAILSNANLQFWERKADSSSVARWMLHKTIDLDQLLSLKSPTQTSWHVILGYDEDGHVIFTSRAHQVYMIQLKTMQFRNLFESNLITTYHPYTSFYAAGRGRGIGSGCAGAETLNNT